MSIMNILLLHAGQCIIFDILAPGWEGGNRGVNREESEVQSERKKQDLQNLSAASRIKKSSFQFVSQTQYKIWCFPHQITPLRLLLLPSLPPFSSL